MAATFGGGGSPSRTTTQPPPPRPQLRGKGPNAAQKFMLPRTKRLGVPWIPRRGLTRDLGLYCARQRLRVSDHEQCHTRVYRIGPARRAVDRAYAVLTRLRPGASILATCSL